MINGHGYVLELRQCIEMDSDRIDYNLLDMVYYGLDNNPLYFPAFVLSQCMNNQFTTIDIFNYIYSNQYVIIDIINHMYVTNTIVKYNQ